MRFQYPEEIERELIEIEPYLVHSPNEKKLIVKSDAPEGTKEKYDAICEKVREIKDSYR